MKVVIVFELKDNMFEEGYKVKTFDSENELQQWLIKNWDNINHNAVFCWTHCREAHYIPNLLAKGVT